jgi:hypothetical protein
MVVVDMMKEYELEFYKNNVKMRSTNFTVSGQNLTMEEVAEQVYRLSMVGGYDRDYDVVVVLDPTETRNYSIDLV